MKRLFVLTVIFVLLNMTNVSLCQNNDELIENQLESEALVQELLLIREDITNNIISRLGTYFSIEELKQAYKESNQEKIIGMIGYTNEKVYDISERLNYIRSELLVKYPELQNYLNTTNINQPDIDNFFDKYFHLDNSLQIKKPLKCKWLPYTATLIVCTSVGPILYWPCAYAAICAWCTGGIADRMCGSSGSPGGSGN